MSSQSGAAEQAMYTNKGLAEQYYGIALPALQQRFGAINTSLGQTEGLPEYMKTAYQEQRTGLTEGITSKEQANVAATSAAGKKANMGGNAFAGMSTSDIGAQLANALYGSRFQEGQAGINQSMNLMSMALGGSGTAGNASLQASGTQLGAIGYMPNYNTSYANVMGGLSAGASVYGALNQAGVFGYPAGQIPGTTLPTATNFPNTVVGSAGGNP